MSSASTLWASPLAKLILPLGPNTLKSTCLSLSLRISQLRQCYRKGRLSYRKMHCKILQEGFRIGWGRRHRRVARSHKGAAVSVFQSIACRWSFWGDERKFLRFWRYSTSLCDKRGCWFGKWLVWEMGRRAYREVPRLGLQVDPEQHDYRQDLV